MLPTEATDAIDPADAIDAIDPAEPIERIEPDELTHRIEPGRVDRPQRSPAGASGSDGDVGPSVAVSRRGGDDRMAGGGEDVPEPAGVGEGLPGGLARGTVRRPKVERPAVVGDLGGPVGPG